MHQFTEEFNDIINNSKYFMMNQLSDIVDENKFQHISFVGKTLVSEVLEQDMTLTMQQNMVVNDNYQQFFITEKIYDEHNDVLNNNVFKKIESYDDLFSGFLRVENYYVLVNSLNHTFNVYVLIDNNNSDKLNLNDEKLDIEFYGFIKIGYLINPRPYTINELDTFETIVEFKLSENLKNYLLNTSIVKYDNKLFHVDLKNLSNDELNNVKQKYGYYGDKLISNIKFLNKYKNEDKEEVIKIINNLEDEHMSKLKHGFLKIGLMKRVQIVLSDDEKYDKNYVEVYLLLNYDGLDERNINYDNTLWTYTYDNKNFDSIFNFDQDENTNYFKRENIFRTLKCSTNIC